MQATLEALEVRPPVIKSIRDGVAVAPKKAGSTLATTFKSLARSAADPLRVSTIGGRYADPVDSCSSEVDDDSATSLDRLDRSVNAILRRRSVSAGAGRPSVDAPIKQSSPAFPLQQHLGCTSPASFSSSSSRASRCSSDAAAAIAIAPDRSAFHPASYLPFLDIPASAAESSAPRKGSVALVDEKSVRAMSNDAEMGKYFRSISASLGCADDWQARIAAMVALQRVCWGYSRDCLAPSLQSAGSLSWKAPLVEVSLLVQHIKDISEQVLYVASELSGRAKLTLLLCLRCRFPPR